MGDNRKAPPASGPLTILATALTPRDLAIVSHGRPASMTNVLLNALKTATAPMATIATNAAGALRILGAQPMTSAMVTILFVTSLPTTTASTVTQRQTAQRDVEGWIAMATVQTLIPSVGTEGLITSVDATPTKTARQERSVTQETWTATAMSASPMVVISWMITALAMKQFVTCPTMKTASTVTTRPADQVASTTATAPSSSLFAAMAAMTTFVAVLMTMTVQLGTSVTRTPTDALKILGATTTTPCAMDLIKSAIFQIMKTASTVTGKNVSQDVEVWMGMKTVLSNSLSVVMVEENTSVDATVTLIAIHSDQTVT